MSCIRFIVALYLTALAAGQGAGLSTPKNPKTMSSEWRKQCPEIQVVEDHKHNLRTNPRRALPKQHLLASCNTVQANGQTRLERVKIPLDKCIGWEWNHFTSSNSEFIAKPKYIYLLVISLNDS